MVTGNKVLVFAKMKTVYDLPTKLLTTLVDCGDLLNISLHNTLTDNLEERGRVEWRKIAKHGQFLVKMIISL